MITNRIALSAAAAVAGLVAVAPSGATFGGARLDGGGLRQLTHSRRGKVNNGADSWSPDGQAHRLRQQPRRHVPDLRDERRRNSSHPGHPRYRGTPRCLGHASLRRHSK